jgi:hypothetical protein
VCFDCARSAVSSFYACASTPVTTVQKWREIDRLYLPGTLDAILKMIRYEGLHGFYKGMGTKIVQSVLAASVLFMVKEELVKFVVLLVARSRTLLLTRSNKR